MARQQCLSCNGIYDDVGPDGVRYFHACPRLSAVELRTKHAAGTLTLSVATAARLAAAIAADAAVPGPPGAASHVEDFWGSLTVARLQARDENLVASLVPGAPASIKAAGAGVALLPPAPATPDVVVLP